MKTLSAVLTLVLCAAPVFAQSPNNSTIVVLVTDQSGAVVRDAKVSVANNQTGAVRDVASGSDGSATITALPLTGTYRVLVSKQGFSDEQLDDVTLRAGETATLKVRLTVGAAKTEVTVYGTTEGVRADAQIGRRLDPATIDETPILGRKITTLPLLNSAFRQGKGTGDLFVNVRVAAHPLFGRKGDHLTLTVPVSFDEAALGAEITVPTLDGAPVTLRIAPGTPTGRVLRVRGRGATTKDGRGDLLVTVEVEVPTELDDAARAAVTAYREATVGHDPRAGLHERSS